MLFNNNWLRQWVPTQNDYTKLAEQLTLLGLEVDNLDEVPPIDEKIVFAKIIECYPHPNADKLQICKVDVGDDQFRQIVCGAKNARTGIYVACALNTAKLANGMTIESRKVRGEASNGMLCSVAELGLDARVIPQDHAALKGIIEFPADISQLNKLGSTINSVLNLSDAIIDIDLTPNRGDCLCIKGLAREVSAINELEMSCVAALPQAATTQEQLEVRLKEPSACARFVGRVMKNISSSAPSPYYIKQQLSMAGHSAIHPIVDVTNYVMLELGHPMHAYDLDKLTPPIDVRRAEPGEEIKLLNGETYSLIGEDLVIADQNGAIGLAGIMGGDRSAVSETTTNIYLECAWFDPIGIQKTARRLSMHTDAAYRFERHVSAYGQTDAVERASELVGDIMETQIGPIIDTCVEEALPRSKPVTLRIERINTVLGVKLCVDKIERYLSLLGIGYTKLGENSGDDLWQVTAPDFRGDLEQEIDFIEEIARLHGYDSIPPILPTAVIDLKSQDETNTAIGDVKRRLITLGYHEAITYSFVNGRTQKKWDFPSQSIGLLNPISQDMDHMRLSLWPGLFDTLVHNARRQKDRAKLFEVGNVFAVVEGKVEEYQHLSGIAWGLAKPHTWSDTKRKMDFFDVKGDVENILAPYGNRVGYLASDVAGLCPGIASLITLDDNVVGTIGAVHPFVLQGVKLAGNSPIVFALELDKIAKPQLPKFTDFSRFPEVRRDLSIVVSKKISYQQVKELIETTVGSILKDLHLFDVYHGEGIDNSEKGLALSLIFQENSKTLQDGDINQIISNVMKKLKVELGGRLRD